jgi:hypothetical protein
MGSALRINYKFKVRGESSGGGAANHPRRRGATHLGAEAGSAAAAGVIRGTPAATKSLKKIYSAAMEAARVIRGIPRLLPKT